MNVLRHDGNAFGVDGAEISVLEETDKVRLSKEARQLRWKTAARVQEICGRQKRGAHLARFLKSQHGERLEAQIYPRITALVLQY